MKHPTRVISALGFNPRRAKSAVWVSVCFCMLAVGIARGAYTPVITPVVCKWYDEDVIIVPAGLSKDDKAIIDKLLKALIEVSGLSIGPEVGAVNKAIKNLGPGRENIDVIIVYACKDNTGVIHRRTQTLTLDGGETMPWWPNTKLAAGEVAREKARLIKKYSKPEDNCCKATPTPSPTPSPSPPTPTPTPKPSPPRTYTGPVQSPTPTPQEHGMAPRQPGKTGETCAVLIAAGKIKVETQGTGETIRHVVDLKIQNLTDQPLTCTVPPMILESGSGKNQHYACPSGQTVALNPHQAKTVPMTGVCLNSDKPPVGRGVSGDLVMNEANPAAPQNPNSHIPVNQAADLLRICAAKYNAADQLQKSGALKNLPYHDPQKQKDIVVQWSTWCDPRISQITGASPATKDDLKKVVYKQLESNKPMSPDTKKKVDQGIDTIFEKVELTTAKAKDLEIPVAGPAVAETASAGAPVGEPPHVTTVQEQKTPTPTPKPCCKISGMEFKVAGATEEGEKIKDWLEKLKEKLEGKGEGAEEIGKQGDAIIKALEAILKLTRPMDIYAKLEKGICEGEKCKKENEIECRLIPRDKSKSKRGMPGGVGGSENEAWPPPVKSQEPWWDEVGYEALARAIANVLKYCECDDGSANWPPADAKTVPACK